MQHQLANIQEEITPHHASNINRLEPSFPPITLAEIRETVKSSKQKSAGKSGITKAHIVNLPMDTITTLRSIFNSAFSLGYFPKIFKHVDISLLEVPGKILEKIVNRRLLRTMETKGLHNDRPHGFRPCRGTDTALAILHETIATARDSGQTVDLVFRDINRTFDKV